MTNDWNSPNPPEKLIEGYTSSFSRTRQKKARVRIACQHERYFNRRKFVTLSL